MGRLLKQRLCPTQKWWYCRCRMRGDRKTPTTLQVMQVVSPFNFYRTRTDDRGGRHGRNCCVVATERSSFCRRPLLVSCPWPEDDRGGFVSAFPDMTHVARSTPHSSQTSLCRSHCAAAPVTHLYAVCAGDPGCPGEGHAKAS